MPQKKNQRVKRIKWSKQKSERNEPQTKIDQESVQVQNATTFSFFCK